MQNCSKCNQSACVCGMVSDDYKSYTTTDITYTPINTAADITFTSQSYSVTLNERQIEDIADRVADIVCEKVLDRLVEKILLERDDNED